MTEYHLTNIKPWSHLEELVLKASTRSGQRVEVRTEPMPESHMPDRGFRYDRSLAVKQGLWCLVGYEDSFDFSRFWEAYRQLQNEDPGRYARPHEERVSFCFKG